MNIVIVLLFLMIAKVGYYQPWINCKLNSIIYFVNRQVITYNKSTVDSIRHDTNVSIYILLDELLDLMILQIW